MLAIGPLHLRTNLLLAPIAGYCDVSFRLVARSCGGVGLACTDLLCPEGVLRENKRSLELSQTCEADSPLAMQLYGADVGRLCEAARWAEDRGADVVDLNMGCPVDKITKRDGGSKLLCDPAATLKMVEQIKASLRRVPLTCKLRLGWDDSCIVAPYLAAKLEEIGVSAITVHGRTTAMRFSGEARLDGIAEVVATVKRIPVIGNGDVKTPADALRMLEKTGCAGIMIGRGALSTPWIFRDIHSVLTTGVSPPAMTVGQIVQLMRDHFYNICSFRNERSAVIEMRKRVSWYAKNLHPCTQLRQEMRLFPDAQAFEEILSRFLDWRSEYDARRARGEVIEEARDEETLQSA